MRFSKTGQDYLYYIKDELSIARAEDNLEWSNEYIFSKINFARQEFWNRMQYTNRKGVAYANSQANVATVSIPENVDTISFVRYNNGTDRPLLDYISMDEYLMLTRTSQSGTPDRYTRNGASILLFPTPSSSVTNGVEFWGRVGITDIEDENSTDGNIENRYFYIVCDLAIAECWAKAEQLTQANARYAKFEKFFADNGFEILSDQTGQDVSTGEQGGYVDETDERRWGTLS